MTRVAVAAIVVVTAIAAGCRPSGMLFYQVTRTRAEQCSIRSNGEFCVEPEQFAPPITEVWAIELRDDVGVLHFEEEVWVLEPVAEDEDPFTARRTALRENVVTDGDGPCTTTTTRAVSFTQRIDGAVAGGLSLSGTFQSSTRLDGPEACGATPVGDRFVDDVFGVAGAP